MTNKIRLSELGRCGSLSVLMVAVLMTNLAHTVEAARLRPQPATVNAFTEYYRSFSTLTVTLHTYDNWNAQVRADDEKAWKLSHPFDRPMFSDAIRNEEVTEWITENGKCRASSASKPQTKALFIPGTKWQNIAIWDGTKCVGVTAQSSGQATVAVTSPKQANATGELTIAQGPGNSLLLHAPDGRPWVQYWKDYSPTTIMERDDGVDYAIITWTEGHVQNSLWVRPDHGYAPARFRLAKDNELLYEVDVTQYTRLGERQLPARLENARYTRAASYGKHIVAQSGVTIVSNAGLQADPSAFQFDLKSLPKGSRVIGEVALLTANRLPNSMSSVTTNAPLTEKQITDLLAANRRIPGVSSVLIYHSMEKFANVRPNPRKADYDLYLKQIEAIRQVGIRRLTKFVPQLLLYFDYPVSGGPISSGPLMVPTLDAQLRAYPAFAAIVKLGKPALPALRSVVADKGQPNIRRYHALEALLEIAPKNSRAAGESLLNEVKRAGNPDLAGRISIALSEAGTSSGRSPGFILRPNSAGSQLVG